MHCGLYAPHLLNDASALRLIGTLLAEKNEVWQVSVGFRIN